MSAQPDLYDEMQKKLRDGLRILEEASEQDPDRLGLALIKLHGALGDCIRLELSEKVRDASQTSWPDLIRYGQDVLGFSESETRMISEADRQQQHVARGGTYAKSRRELVNYAGFVERRCAAPRTSVGPMQAEPPGLEAPERGRPWFTSAWLIIAYSAVLIVFFCILGLFSYSDTLLEFAKRTFEGLPPQSSTAAPALPTPTSAAANPNAACVILWVEYPDDLGRMSRARVYEELIDDEVKDAGMTAREFYEQVVEQNPVLEADDYEFMSGKTYLLPQCQ